MLAMPLSYRYLVPELTESIEEMAGSVPKVHRHRVRVRGIDTEYCTHVPGIPEWWHFPECDRHYYFAPIEDAASLTRAPHHVRSPSDFCVCHKS